MFLPWKDEYNLGIKEIDEQHQHFVQTLGQLFEAISKQEVKAKLQSIFEELEVYSELHFATEEKYFDEFNYEGAVEHKAKHREFREKMESFKRQIADNELEISYALADFLEDWLLEHVVELDKKYVQCFKDHGLK